MSPRPYGSSAKAYLAAGYWPLPLPPRKKASPPEGYTGRNGREVSADDVDRWRAEHHSGNIGLRPPRGVVGIDVDAYKDEDHVAAWEELAARLGPLPDAPWCSSRDDGISGVRLFRVPESWEAAGKLPEGSNGVSPGEVIQWHHRYVVCPPSIHPDTGRAYRWRSGSITRVADLPALPQPWLEALSSAAAPAQERARPVPTPRTDSQADCRPGDDFNERADWLTDILGPHGWERHHEAGGTLYVTRPGKSRRDGHSATIGHSKDGAERLYVFSADAAPFEPETPYTKFGAYALLNHGGDHKAAARELGRIGYGRQQQATVSSPATPADNEPPEMGPHPADRPQRARAAAVQVREEDQAGPEPSEPLPEIPEFPVARLAGPLRAFIDWGTKDGLHPECTAAAGLAALVTLTGPARLRLSDAKTIKAILWTALVGVASSGKSPAYEHAFSLIRKAYVEQRRNYDAGEAEWRERAEALGKKEAGSRPVRPEPFELDDATTEAVARWLIARGDDASGSIVDDELAAFLEGLNQYKGGLGSDMSKWLKLWTGAPLHIQRVGNGGSVNEVSLYVPEPVVSITGPLVPGNLHLLGKPGSGFRPRWLPFYAPPFAPSWNDAGPYPGEWVACIGDLIEHREPRAWSLAGKARSKWEIARQRWHDQQYEAEPDDVIEALRKADTQALRIALVLAESLNPGAGGEISADAVSCAVAITDYCIKVWRALPGNSTMTVSRREDVMDTAHRRLVAWLETRPPRTEGLSEGSKPRPGASRREVQLWLHESPRKLNELIMEHRDRWPDCVVPVKPDHGGRPTVWLYAPPRGSSQASGAMLPQHRSGTSEHPSSEMETPAQGNVTPIRSDVASDVASGERHRSATSLEGLRAVVCPSCGAVGETTVPPGERAYCKHCETEYIAA